MSAEPYLGEHMAQLSPQLGGEGWGGTTPPGKHYRGAIAGREEADLSVLALFVRPGLALLGYSSSMPRVKSSLTAKEETKVFRRQWGKKSSASTTGKMLVIVCQHLLNYYCKFSV